MTEAAPTMEKGAAEKPRVETLIDRKKSSLQASSETAVHPQDQEAYAAEAAMLEDIATALEPGGEGEDPDLGSISAYQGLLETIKIYGDPDGSLEEMRVVLAGKLEERGLAPTTFEDFDAEIREARETVTEAARIGVENLSPEQSLQAASAFERTAALEQEIKARQKAIMGESRNFYSALSQKIASRLTPRLTQMGENMDQRFAHMEPTTAVRRFLRTIGERGGMSTSGRRAALAMGTLAGLALFLGPPEESEAAPRNTTVAESSAQSADHAALSAEHSQVTEQMRAAGVAYENTLRRATEWRTQGNKDLADRFQARAAEQQTQFLELQNQQAELAAKIAQSRIEGAAEAGLAAAGDEVQRADQRLESFGGVGNQPAPETPGTPAVEATPAQRVERLGRNLGADYNSYVGLDNMKALSGGNKESVATAENMQAGVAARIIRLEPELALAQKQAGGWPEYGTIIDHQANLNQYLQKIRFMEQAYQISGTKLSAETAQALVEKTMIIARAVSEEAKRRGNAAARGDVTSEAARAKTGAAVDVYQQIQKTADEAFKRLDNARYTVQGKK